MPTEHSRVVKMKRETFALFDQMYSQLNERLPYGTITRAELLDMCVSSYSAVVRAGQVQIGKPPKEEAERK